MSLLNRPAAIAIAMTAELLLPTVTEGLPFPTVFLTIYAGAIIWQARKLDVQDKENAQSVARVIALGGPCAHHVPGYVPSGALMRNLPVQHHGLFISVDATAQHDGRQRPARLVIVARGHASDGAVIRLRHALWCEADAANPDDGEEYLTLREAEPVRRRIFVYVGPDDHNRMEGEPRIAVQDLLRPGVHEPVQLAYFSEDGVQV